ncbi:NADPH-dependent FMN reductase [Methanoplanus limicola DSM 2279]|uniref:NADPH-dependent FMN reductase n=2 Tax=Methanoplanus limicola TaxID=2315 RepID=H1Z338_9EURY|nr:NADPH-dependent FMN reductase [Methanoplanus limicola DSM 2279]
MLLTSGILMKNDFVKNNIRYSLILKRYNLTAMYPEMYLYVLTLSSSGNVLAEFRTNTYEYSPTVPYSADQTACKLYSVWMEGIENEPEEYIEYLEKNEYNKRKRRERPETDSKDAVIIQGSPRPDGNCAIISGWVKETLESSGLSCKIIFPDDMIIHPCIGCYQCYNYGCCTFKDEMDEIIGSVKNSSLLIVCTPVYTDTVPAGIKICIDRFQSYHAMNKIAGIRGLQITEPSGNNRNVNKQKKEIKGLLFSVAGRKGKSNFDHLLPVIEAFFANAKIRYSGRVLADNMDNIRDISKCKNLEDKIKNLTKKTAES